MVYCNLKQKGEKSAIYYYGATTDDITGEVEVYAAAVSPVIIKPPHEGGVTNSALIRLAIKYEERFMRGEFPEKIAYQR